LPLFDSLAALQAASAPWPGRSEVLIPIDHALTHFDWRLDPVRHKLPTRLASSRLTPIESVLQPGQWVTRGQALALGLPAPVRKLLQNY
jgi:A/G-specific adenine glycosylase